MRHTHHAEQWLPYPVETVFDFFANPNNLPCLMPPWQRVRISSASFVAPPPRPNVSGTSSSPSTIVGGQGTRMTITFQPVPFIPFRLDWDAEITEFVWDDHFCDIQLARGPFAYWRHCHHVKPLSREGIPGTQLFDDVEYELPFGSLGDMADRLFNARQMYSLFLFRQRRTIELLAHT